MKIIAKILRKIYRAFHPHQAYNHITIPDEDVSDFLLHQIESNQPFCMARFGNGEFLSMQYGYLMSESKWKRVKSYIRGFNTSYKPDVKIGEEALKTISFFSGFFPRDIQLLDRFYRLMLNSLNDVDLLGVVPWNKEDLFAEYYSNQIEYCGYDRFEPYDYAEPWTKALEGKKVLVIHPFEDSIRSQYEKRNLIFKDELLPPFDLDILKAVQTIGEDNNSGFATWFDALDFMYKEAMKRDFDVAIIGCGAYGMPLAARLKQAGKKAIHLGGVTQCLFGIKGSRWVNSPIDKKIPINENWVYPKADETPNGAQNVEGGCYWK